MVQVEALMRCQGADCHPELRAALEQLLAAGGKRIRPTMGLLTGRMLGAPRDKLIILSAAVELLHTATLVHDDLIDGALLRRGSKTLNAQWSPPATVLTGDFIFARSAKLAAETNHLPLMKNFAETLAIIVNGELTQLFTARGNASRDNYYTRIQAKTASLMEMTTRAAAMVSPVEDSMVEDMRLFGYHLGMAFQIVDDVLDFAGEQNEVGKPVGSDLLQGLITLPTLFYMDKHPEDPRFQFLLGGKFLLERSSMESLVQDIRQADAIELSLEEGREQIKTALQYLFRAPENEERHALEGLAQGGAHRHGSLPPGRCDGSIVPGARTQGRRGDAPGKPRAPRKPWPKPQPPRGPVSFPSGCSLRRAPEAGRRRRLSAPTVPARPANPLREIPGGRPPLEPCGSGNFLSTRAAARSPAPALAWRVSRSARPSPFRGRSLPFGGDPPVPPPLVLAS